MSSSLPAPEAEFQRTHIFALAAMISSAAAVGAGISLGLPLLSLVLEARGVSGAMIGLNTAMAGIASLVVIPFVTPLAARIGAWRLLIGALLTTGVSFYGFHIVENYWGWFPLRLVFHGSLTVAFVMSEFWINSLSPPGRRGLVMGIYATILSLGFSAGPAVLAVVGSHGPLPFAIGSVILIAAALPVLTAVSETPELEPGPRRSVIGFVFAAPVATFAALAFGAIESGGMAILPIYGLRLGLTETVAAKLVSAVALGNLLMQIPIGMLSDRIDRRDMLLACAAVGVLGALALPLVAPDFWQTALVLVVWGGVVAGLYTVGLTLLGASYSGSNLAAANAAFIMMYSVGMLIGPPAIGAGLDVFADRHSPHGAPYVMAGIFAVYLAIVLAERGWRWLAPRLGSKQGCDLGSEPSEIGAGDP
ncbi:MAG: MFS transporter [Ancalomicrobiaceae bacterium]|nr:MFS transporter [Ancalomicrobiaceae bacterium]